MPSTAERVRMLPKRVELRRALTRGIVLHRTRRARVPSCDGPRETRSNGSSAIPRELVSFDVRPTSRLSEREPFDPVIADVVLHCVPRCDATRIVQPECHAEAPQRSLQSVLFTWRAAALVAALNAQSRSQRFAVARVASSRRRRESARSGGDEPRFERRRADGELAAYAPRVKRSAGLLMYRRTTGALEVLLVHPGGPFFRNEDAGAWTIPKGEPGPDEDLLAVALREFREETGLDAQGPFI